MTSVYCPPVARVGICLVISYVLLVEQNVCCMLKNLFMNHVCIVRLNLIVLKLKMNLTCVHVDLKILSYLFHCGDTCIVHKFEIAVLFGYAFMPPVETTDLRL